MGSSNLLVNKVCVQYQMKETPVIVAGDCGFGFERKGYYENIVKRNAKRVNESNNWFLFIRGNHDNPAYFDGKTFRHKRFTCIPDYSVVKATGHTILCVGGAISVGMTDTPFSYEEFEETRSKLISDVNNKMLTVVFWSVLKMELLNGMDINLNISKIIHLSNGNSSTFKN